MTCPSTLPATSRFSLIITGLVTSVVGWSSVLGPLGSVICTHLCRLQHRFRVLVDQVRAGKVPPERTRARPAAGAERVARPAAASALPKLPRRYAWLVALIQDTANNGTQLVYLLEDPEMAALVAASPGLRRLLRSMCSMLAVSPMPELIRLPPRERRAKARADKVSVASSERYRAGFGPPMAATEDGGLQPTLRSKSRSASRSARRLGRLPELGSSAWVAAMRRQAGGGFSSA